MWACIISLGGGYLVQGGGDRKRAAGTLIRFRAQAGRRFKAGGGKGLRFTGSAAISFRGRREVINDFLNKRPVCKPSITANPTQSATIVLQKGEGEGRVEKRKNAR